MGSGIVVPHFITKKSHKTPAEYAADGRSKKWRKQKRAGSHRVNAII